MKLITSLLLVAAPMAAFAAGPTGTARVAGSAVSDKVVANSNIWHCHAGNCRGPAEDRAVAVQRLCKDLARQVGAVESLTVGTTTLDADALADCNKRARKPKA